MFGEAYIGDYGIAIQEAGSFLDGLMKVVLITQGETLL